MKCPSVSIYLEGKEDIYLAHTFAIWKSKWGNGKGLLVARGSPCDRGQDDGIEVELTVRTGSQKVGRI